MTTPPNRRRFLAGLALGSLTLTTNGVVAFAATPSQTKRPDHAAAVQAKIEEEANLIFLSGTAALDLYHRHPHVPQDEVLPSDAEAQTHMALRNLYEVLRVEGLEWTNITSLICYQQNMADQKVIRKVLNQHFQGWSPALSFVEIRKLSAPNSLLELEAIAIAPRPARKDRSTADMTDLEIIHTRPKLADSMIFAPGIRVDAQSDLIFLSGITAADLEETEKNVPLPNDFGEQVRMATRNIDRILQALNVGKDRIVRIVSFYTDDFDGREMGRYLEGWRPCSSAIGISALPQPGAKIMFDLIIAA
ncbi:hypothetical protein GCM10007972_12410 [Iodidimonas muriae]|uniref:RidA family protein n=1 Tax=Iodidimonas muriae TaxID=261467 RepID=A0ABQ2LD87_9PROT|nr:RidA family protein [Iodidimonas muriae]GER06759.1 hypothetical protein JCM17843_10690 [Kordiimonadales bacterium JCM 17843]GGO10099.1 hypothetical protein GCM10007972_12410 [Iodidimonas muriae]